MIAAVETTDNTRKKRLRTALATAICVVGVGSIFYQWTMGSSNSAQSTISVFYSADDGQTFFADSEARVPPFDYQGKSAVRAHVYKCGSKAFVAYLEQFSPEARRIIAVAEKAVLTAKPGDPPPPEVAQAPSAQRNGRMIKRPGERNWVPINSPAGAAIQHVICPGSQEQPKLYTPE